MVSCLCIGFNDSIIRSGKSSGIDKVPTIVLLLWRTCGVMSAALISNDWVWGVCIEFELPDLRHTFEHVWKLKEVGECPLGAELMSRFSRS